MIEIKYEVFNEGDFKTFTFKTGDNLGYDTAFAESCAVCDNILIDDHYYMIIKDLIRAGLLPDSYEHLCCNCYKEIKAKSIGK